MILRSLLALASVEAVWALTISPQDVSATIVALVALVTAVGTMVVNIMNARSVKRALVETAVVQADTAKAATKQVAAVHAQAEVIVGHVNSAASAAAAKIDGLQRELELLRGVIAESKQAAALLAQQASVTKETQ